MMTVNVARPGEVVIVLLELGLVAQSYQAVLERWSPRPAMSIESFQSALVGRFLVLSTQS